MSGGVPKLRVHWVSPLPSAQTDIAHYTRRILPELAAVTDLTLWTDAPDWDRELYDFARVRQLDPDRVTPRDFALAGRRDGMPGQGPEVVFVNMGNAAVFHAGFLRMIQRIPSIVVLHDMALQEMYFDAMARGIFSRAEYEAGMARWHGQAGVDAARDVFEGRSKLDALVQSHPGFELTLEHAVSVLTHTPVARDAVDATGTVPTYLMDLPFRPSSTPPQAARDGLGPLRFVQFGYTGPNRRLQKVLEALGPLKDEVDFRFDVMGNLWDPGLIHRQAEALGIADRVHLHGFVKERMLDAYLAQAHLVFNLRYPSMGEASGSQMRIWNAASASVVTNLGWYSDLAEGTTFKIEHAEEVPALQALIRRLAADRTIGHAVGVAGRAQLEAHHTPTLYAAGVAEVAARFTQDAATALRARSLNRAAARAVKVPVSTS
jgi:glycosyltransferase involved in cell wall biosynthesis